MRVLSAGGIDCREPHRIASGGSNAEHAAGSAAARIRPEHDDAVLVPVGADLTTTVRDADRAPARHDVGLQHRSARTESQPAAVWRPEDGTRIEIVGARN